MRVEIEGGKYTYQFHPNGRSEVLRYGEPWRDVVGDKFIYCMASEIEKLRQRVQELTAERDAMKQLYESSEESVLALKETRNRLAEERDALKQQRDGLVAALINHQEQTRPIKQTIDAIASVKEK